MANTNNNTITENDFDKALLLIPIIMGMGVSVARRFILKNALTSEQLIEKAQEFNADTDARNAAFAQRLSGEG